MHTERLFAAITLPEDLKTGLAGLHADFPGLKWSAPETMHLTLRFIGQTPAERVEAVRRSLRDDRRRAFRLTVAGLGLFPGEAALFFGPVCKRNRRCWN
jgi:2'-5' RNA ligase